MKNLGNLALGVLGTFTSYELDHLPAHLAGLATAAWMLRQLWLSFSTKK